MKKEKKKGSCLKTLLIVFGMFIVIGIIGNLAGGNAEDTSTINTPNDSASESTDDSQEDTLNTSALSSNNDAASGESSYKDEILEEETHSEESTESSEENQSENETDLPFIEEYDNEIVVSSKMILERFISGYTTLQLMPMATLTLKLLFQGFHKSIRFYACFEVLQESGIKYLLTDSAAEGEPEFLHAFAAVF